MSLKAIASLDYVVLPCRDLRAARRFYRDVLGFDIVYERADWIRFQIGTTALALRPLDGAFEGRRVEGPAVQLAFRVGQDEVDACYEELKACGVEVLDPPRDQTWGHRTLYFTDPEGNVLEVYAELPESRG
ncbi:MAG: VOC family protein [Kiloniellales bacterium]|nr:VOC family protein [Kiloniellales bacterium]